MPLDSRTVDAIHTRLMVRYGARFAAMYAGVDPQLVKADWAEVLDGVSPLGVRYALANAPIDHPPNAAQFLALCLQAPRQHDHAQIAETRPPADPQLLSRLRRRVVDMQANASRKQWAYELRERERRGERLSGIQRRAWREALRVAADAPIEDDPRAAA